MAIELLHGDCIAEMAAMAAAGRTVQSVVTDPPYGWGFMGRAWDAPDTIAFRPETWRLALDVLEPGGMLAAFGGARTQHRIMCAIEDAGFEIRDCVLWLHSQGFPKSRSLLKPSYEPIVLARKPGPLRPLSIDACRVGTGDDRTSGGNPSRADFSAGWGMASTERATGGRWPPNILHDGSPEVLGAFAAFGQRKSGGYPPEGGQRSRVVTYGKPNARGERKFTASTGDASRFFPALGYSDDDLRFHYCGKASRRERGEGNTHNTVKPLSLVRWLTKLITPPGGTVLDIFAGSGTTGLACQREGFDCVLVERELEYVAMARRRLGLDFQLEAAD